ncbi:MAG: hypothetical protein KGY50_01075 [Candidatus Thermoplasmatota archaeon]|nr:hypothetical protein [Candidatus Thermoplasmatota archaeon]
MKNKCCKIIAILLISFLFLSISLSFSKSVNLNKPNTTQYDLLIVTPKEYHRACNNLMNHKINKGMETFIKTTEFIFENYPGEDQQERIKYCIKEAYDEHHVSYVLLIGDFKDIPVRYCYNDDEYESFNEPYFISELYYADIYDDQGFFSSWNTDNDEFYGEWSGEYAEDVNISLTPEVAVGRLPCSNRLQLKIMINKIIRYETEENCEEWCNRFVVAGGDTYSEARGYTGSEFSSYEGEELNREVMAILNDFESIPLWASTGTLSTFSLLKEVNRGCGFLYLSGHGSPGIWCTHPPNSAEKIGNLPNYFIPFLKNTDKLPVCVVGGCHNNQFDVNPLRIVKDPFFYATWHRDCWGWRLACNPWGGSIATIGCTGLGWQGIEFGGGGSNWLNLQFFREYAKGENTLGSLWKNSVNKYIQTFPIEWHTHSGGTSSLNAKTVQEWVLIGDPSLEIKVS